MENVELYSYAMIFYVKMQHKLHQNNLSFNVLDKKYKLGMIIFVGWI
jgi:hypothetical protein